MLPLAHRPRLAEWGTRHPSAGQAMLGHPATLRNTTFNMQSAVMLLGGQAAPQAGLNQNSSRCTVAAAATTAGRIAPSQERQQHVARDKAAERRRKSVNIAKLLTNHIVAASSLEQLHDILAMHANTLDHIHVAALLSRTAHICSVLDQQNAGQPASAGGMGQLQQQPDQQQFIQQNQQQDRQQLLIIKLTEMMAQRLRHAKAHTLIAAVAALGRLGSLRNIKAGPSPQQLQQFAAKTHELLPFLNLSQLAVILWGLAKAGYKPPSSWLGSMLTAFMQQYETASAAQEHQQQQEQDARLLAQQQQQQDSRLQRPALPSTSKQQQIARQPQRRELHSLPDFNQRPHQHSLATDLSLVIYSLAVMGKQPSATWLAQWQTAVLQQLPAASMQDLSQDLWAAASLGLCPEHKWLDAVLAMTVPLLSGASAWSLGSVIGALARFNHQPKQEWMDAFLAALQEQESLAANPQAFSYCLSSLAQLKLQIEPSTLNTLLDRSTDHLASFSPWQLANTSWACASMNFTPSPSWTKKFLAVTARSADAGKFTVNQLSSVIWSLALIKRSGEALLASQQLQIMVLLQALAAASNGQGLMQLGPNSRSGLAWALANLGMVPNRQWLGQYLAACFEGGLAEDHVRCANVLFCIAALDYEYLVEWLEGFLSGGATLGGSGGVDLSLEKYAALVGVLQALSEMDSKQLRAAWLELSNTEWSAESAAGSDGMMSFAVQLPPSLANWVDSMVAPAAAPAAPPTATAAAAAGGATAF